MIKNSNRVVLCAAAALVVVASPALAQNLGTFALPAAGVDIAIARSGAAVATISGSGLLWVQDSTETGRTITLDPNDYSVVLTRDGSIARLQSATSKSMYEVQLASDLVSLRSYSADTTVLAVTPDEKTILTGLVDNTLLVTTAELYVDLGTVALEGVPRAVVISPNSKFAFVATGVAGNKLVKINISKRTIVQKMRSAGAISRLAIAPNGAFIYATVSRTLSDGSTRHTLEVFDVARGSRVQSRKIQVAGGQPTTFDIEASKSSIYLSSTQPLVVGSREAGVIRFPLSTSTLGSPKVFANPATGAGALAINLTTKKLGVVNTASPSVTFVKIP
mgnify:CR=1 FL=1